MLAYPKAEQTITSLDGGAMIGGNPRTVWHTTETYPSAFYTNKTYYHLQVREDPSSGQILWRQFIDLSRASRALRHEDSVETNRMGTYCPNIAIVGYAKDSPDLSDGMVNEVAEFIAWAEQVMGIPAVFPYPFLGGEAYGYDGAARLNRDEWVAVTGNVGHQHAYRNTHWDPGKFPTDRILETLGGPNMKPPDWALPATQWHIDQGIYTEATPADVDEDLAFHRQTVFRHRFYQKVVAPKVAKDQIARDQLAKIHQATNP